MLNINCIKFFFFPEVYRTRIMLFLEELIGKCEHLNCTILCFLESDGIYQLWYTKLLPNGKLTSSVKCFKSINFYTWLIKFKFKLFIKNLLLKYLKKG